MSTPADHESRRQRQADAVAREVMRGAKVESDADYQAVLVSGDRVNHLLHFIVGIFTCGWWWIVWIFFALTGGEKRYIVRTDEFGNTRVEKGKDLAKGIVAAVVGGAILLMVFLIVVSAVSGSGSETSSGDAVPTSGVTPTRTPTPEPVEPTASSLGGVPAITAEPTVDVKPTVTSTSTATATATPEPTPVPGYGAGTYAVGRDITPGIYAGRAGEGLFASCYWARLSGVSGQLDDIIANDNANGQFYIHVLESDGYLEVGCRIVPIEEWPLPDAPSASVEPGMHLVGRDIAPGTYQGEAGTGFLDSCYWGRLSGLSGELDDIIANDNANGSFYVSVSPTDVALATHCALELVEE